MLAQKFGTNLDLYICKISVSFMKNVCAVINIAQNTKEKHVLLDDTGSERQQQYRH